MEVSVLVPLPIWKGSLLSPPLLKREAEALDQFLTLSYSKDFEWIIAPYGHGKNFKPTFERWNLSNVEWTLGSYCLDRAIQKGLSQCKGEILFLLNPKQPVDLIFYKNALKELQGELKTSVDLIRGNRRLDESEFHVPVRLLPLIYSRHKLGLTFNKILKRLLPVGTTDTQAANLVFKNTLACKALAYFSFKSFLFFTELSIFTKEQRLLEKDIPVRIFLNREKSRKKIVKETFFLAKGLILLIWKASRGGYHPLETFPTRITADDWGLSRAINDGILELARLGVVKRVSLMGRGAFLEHRLKELRDIPDITLGLHFNLTHRMLGSPRSLFFQTIKAQVFKKRAFFDSIRTELTEQLDQLEALKVKVSYIDGHHHIHLLPGLINHIATLLKQRGITQVRLPLDKRLWLTKKFPLMLLCWVAKKSLKDNGFCSYPCIYPRYRDFESIGHFNTSISRDPHAEIIVHPAKYNDLESLGIPDSYTAGRVREYELLKLISSLF